MTTTSAFRPLLTRLLTPPLLERVPRGFALGLGALLFFGTPTRSRADPAPAVVVVPVTRGDQDLAPLVALAGEVDSVLSARDVAHLSPTEAAALFEQRHSRAPTPLSRDALERFVREASQALAAASESDWPRAISLIRSAMAFGESSLVAMNRNQSTADKLFSACLLAIQALIESGDLPGARAQALECRARSPGMELAERNRSSYDKLVPKLLEEAKQSLARDRVAPLVVESSRSCPVVVNGRRLGETAVSEPGATKPSFRLEHPARRPYLVQVDCDGQPGRVHVLVPGDDRESLDVDVPFEQAVSTDNGALSLRYALADSGQLPAHVRALMTPKALGVAHAILVTHLPPGRLALQLFGGATIFLDASHTQAKVEAAVSTLLDQVLEGGEADGQAEVASPVGRPARRPLGLATWEKVTGLTMLTAGVALTLTSFWRDYQRYDDGERYLDSDPDNPSYYDLGKSWSRARNKPYVLGGIGAGLSFGSTLWLSVRGPARTLPWWADWGTGVGAVGVALAIWGVVDIAQGGSCGQENFADTRLCARERNVRDRGALLLMTSVAPLTLWAVRLGRFESGPRTRATVFVTPRLAARSAGLELGLRL